jgi:hypothetical protein
MEKFGRPDTRSFARKTLMFTIGVAHAWVIPADSVLLIGAIVLR